MKLFSSTLWQLLKIDAIALGIGMLTTALIVAALVIPVFHSRYANADLASRLEAVTEHYMGASERVQSLQRNLQQLNEQIEGSRVRLAPLSELNQRLARIAALSGERGVELETMTPGEVVSTPKASSIAIKIVGRSTASAFQDLLRAFHAEFSDTVVTALSLDRASESEVDASENVAAGSAPPRVTIDLIWYAAPSSQTNAAPPSKS